MSLLELQGLEADDAPTQSGGRNPTESALSIITCGGTESTLSLVIC